MELNERQLQILEDRGLDAEMLQRLGVSASDRGSSWIEIAYVLAGKQVNTKFRTIEGEKAFSQQAGAVKCFWNFDVITDETLADYPLIITEGEFDAIAAIQCGFIRSVSVPDGAPAEARGEDDKGTKYSYVTDAQLALKSVKEIVLCTDGDGPGVNLLNDLAIRLGRHRCKWVKYPQGCKDLNDALKKFGARGVKETIARAQWMKVSGLYRMSELPPLPVQRTHSIGMEGMDRHFKIRPGDFYVVTGNPSHGKSSFVNEIVCRMALAYDWVTAIASFEQRPQTDHRRNLRTFFNAKMVIYQSAQEIDDADRWIEKHFVFLVPDEDEDVDLKWLLERAQASVVQFGARMVVIDPWNEMDHIRPREMSLTEYTGFAIKQFRKLAAKYQVPVFVVAHPTKLRPEKAGQPLPIPSLYDISDSAHWFNKCDAGIIIHRVDENETLIRIQKTRYHDQIGVPGDLKAKYRRDLARYEFPTPTYPTYPGEVAA